MSSRLNSPLVRVPVLSNTKSVAWARVSRAWPRVERRPTRVSRPRAAVRAAGVASDSAQGQETTSTETVIQKAFEASTTYQMAGHAGGDDSNANTNQLATRSAIMARRGFSARARSSRRTMPESTVSAPTFSTFTTIGLARLRVPPMMGLPACLATGCDSR